MENKTPSLPDFVFDWLQTRPFQALSPAEKEQVLAHLSAEAYEEMHQTAVAIRHFSREGGKRKEEMLDSLLNRFDQLHPPSPRAGKVIPLFTPANVWKAAALALLMSSIGLALRLFQTETPGRLASRNRVDTLYQIRVVAAEPIRVIDTVYRLVYRDRKETDPGPGTENPEMPASGTGTLATAETLGKWEVEGILPLDALHHKANETKHNSMKDDTLIRQYSVVSL